MLLSRRSFTAGALALAGCAGKMEPGPTSPLASGRELRTWLDAETAAGRFSGVVLIAAGDRKLAVQGFGVADRERNIVMRHDMRFNLTAVSSMFTAVAIAQLAEKGALSYSDLMSRHLPDFPRSVAERITIHQLLTHTSGLGDFLQAPGWEATRSRIRTVNDYMTLVSSELAFEPGEQWRYSNMGNIVLGAIIERLTGADYFDHIADAVIHRAGMRHTGFPTIAEYADDMVVPYAPCLADQKCAPGALADVRHLHPNRGGPAGGAWSTAEDLLRFVRALRGGQLVSSETLALMCERHAALQAGAQYGYGYGFFLVRFSEQNAYGHGGARPGAGNQLETYVDRPLTLIVLTNISGVLRPALEQVRAAAVT